MSKRHNILLTRNSYFISSAGEIESAQELKTKFFSSCFNAGYMLTYCSFPRM